MSPPKPTSPPVTTIAAGPRIRPITWATSNNSGTGAGKSCNQVVRHFNKLAGPKPCSVRMSLPGCCARQLAGRDLKMREHGLGYLFFLAAMIFASQCLAQRDEKGSQLDSRRTSVSQKPEPTSPRIGSISPPFENKRSCTYRGGPKTGIWSCQ